MAVRYLISSILFILVFSFNETYGKTIYGRANIIDGDTLHINNYKIRLHAIDAPETDQTCKKGDITWNCGIEATKFLKNIIDDKKIICKSNSKDRYNRFIGVCYKDKLDLNSLMVLSGWAIAYRYYSLDYIEEEEEAKSKKIGIWSGEFEEPYLFRKKNN